MASLAIVAVAGAGAWGATAIGLTAATGWAAGSLVGSLLFAKGGGGRDQVGPRLENLKVTSATRGTPITRVYGTSRIGGNLMWTGGLVETKHEDEVGKGGSETVDVIWYTYSASFTVALCEGPITGVRRIWADAKVIYDIGENASATQVLVSKTTGYTIYAGDETQLPSALTQTAYDTDSVPSSRGIAYIEFNDMQLEEYGNRIPNITAEVIGDGSEAAGSVDPVYSYAGFDRFEDTTYFDGVYFYYYRAIRAGNGKSFEIHTEKWSIGQQKIEFAIWTYPSELSVSASDNGVYSFDPDEPGFLLKKTTTAVPWVLTYTKYNSSEGIDFDIGAPTGNQSDVWATKSGSHFYFVFSTAFDTGTYIKYARANWPVSSDGYIVTVDVGWPDTVTPGTISNLPAAIASDAYYMYMSCSDSVEGPIIVRYALSDPLNPVDWKSVNYANTPWGNSFDVDNGTLVSCTGTGVGLTILVYKYATWESALTLEATTLDNAYAAASNTESLHIWWTADYTALWGDDRFNLGEAGVEYSNLSSNTVTLASVITAICAATGLAAADIDVSGLTDTVTGYPIGRQEIAANSLDPLLTAYGVTTAESDWKIVFLKADDVAAEAVDVNEFGATAKKRANELVATRMMDSDLPRRINVQYSNFDTDYQTAVQRAQRIIN